MDVLADLALTEWLVAIAGVASAAAAWYAAFLSRRNSRRLAARERVVLSAMARHVKYIRANSTRKPSVERVEIRILNRGRPVQIDRLLFVHKGATSVPEGLYREFVRFTSDRAFDLDTHKTLTFDLGVESLLALDDPSNVERRPIRVYLADGHVVRMRAKALAKILRALSQYKRDLAAGYELQLPERWVRIGNTGKSIEAYDGQRIPDDARITGEDNEPIPQDEEAEWRSGRNPQREQIESARSQKPRRRWAGVSR